MKTLENYPWVYKNFTQKEVACKCGCGLMPKKEMIDTLQALRTACGFPFIVTSGARCPDYNSKVSNTASEGEHTRGEAIDLNLFGENLYFLMSFIFPFYFFGSKNNKGLSPITRIGLHQKGDVRSRFIHLGISTAEHLPHPTIWTY